MKKLLKFTPILVLAILLSSCSSVRVAADYDREANFDQYKTFAFFKPGIDKAEISDIDKRRILRAIEAELLAKVPYELLLAIFPVWASKDNFISNILPLKPKMFDCVIIDEASFCRANSAIPALIFFLNLNLNILSNFFIEAFVDFTSPICIPILETVVLSLDSLSIYFK